MMFLPWHWAKKKVYRSGVGELDGKELEELWDGLLSRDPERVMAAFALLGKREQGAVVSHLKRMVSEPGWQPGQSESARSALEILKRQYDD